MAAQTPLADLIRTRMEDLGLDREALGFRLGAYKNPLKAAGRVHALIDGHITTEKSRRALARLPEALEVDPEVVDRSIVATEELFAERRRQAEEERRIAREKEDAQWRAAFKPHAVIWTERTFPNQITICGLTGGAERWLMIRFDLSKSPITFIQQVLEALPRRAPLGRNDERGVMFFGRVLCFVVNYSPDEAVRCDLDGRPLEVLTKAYRPGEVTVHLGGRRVEPRVMARILGAL